MVHHSGSNVQVMNLMAQNGVLFDQLHQDLNRRFFFQKECEAFKKLQDLSDGLFVVEGLFEDAAVCCDGKNPLNICDDTKRGMSACRS